MIHHQKTLPRVDDGEREVHPTWLLKELVANQITFNCQKNFRERALSELSQEGDFIVPLPKVTHSPMERTTAYAEKFARTLDFFSFLREESGAFLISTGPAIFDAVSNQLLGGSRFSNRTHTSLDFYVLDRDLAAFLNCLNELRICPSNNLVTHNEQVSFSRHQDHEFQNGKLSLVFQTDLFVKLINFYVVEELASGFLFNFEDHDFIYPEKYLCEPEIVVKTNSNQALTGLPLIKLPIANFVASSQEKYWEKTDRKNIYLMHFVKITI